MTNLQSKLKTSMHTKHELKKHKKLKIDPNMHTNKLD